MIETHDIPRGRLNVKDQVFFGSDGCMEKCGILHRDLEDAFSLIGGMQQPPRPCDPEESFDEYSRMVDEGTEEVMNLATGIVKGLLGKDYIIAKKV